MRYLTIFFIKLLLLRMRVPSIVPPTREWEGTDYAFMRLITGDPKYAEHETYLAGHAYTK